MDKTFNARKAELLLKLQCAICLDGVQDAKLCPRCSQFYCNKCIQKWMSKSNNCPNCQAAVCYDGLVLGRSINAMQESFTQLLDCMDYDLCGSHKQQLILFCYSCKVNICAKCWFSPDHAEHKERVVPLDEAYEHYRQTLKTALVWVNGQKKLVHQKLQQLAKNRQQLKSECKQIEKLCDDSGELAAGEASSAALTNIRCIVGTIAELRLEHERDTDAIRIDDRDFMLEPTVLVFGMSEFRKIILEENSYELNSKDPYGFLWKCTVNVSDNQEGEDNDGATYNCYLSLIEGKPSEYSVTFGNQPEKVLGFELHKEVMLGCFKPDIEYDICRVTVEIRQTYTDRIQRLQDHIAQLEKQCASQKSFYSDWITVIWAEIGTKMKEFKRHLIFIIFAFILVFRSKLTKRP